MIKRFSASLIGPIFPATGFRSISCCFTTATAIWSGVPCFMRSYHKENILNANNSAFSLLLAHTNFSIINVQFPIVSDLIPNCFLFIVFVLKRCLVHMPNSEF